MEAKHKKHFLLEKVVTFPYYVNYLLGFVIVAPLCLLYGLIGIRYFGIWGLMFTFLLAALLVMNIIKYLSKSITISFDDAHIYLEYDSGKIDKFAKSDISGFYSYNYERIEKSFISIQIVFKNGDKVEMTDINISEKVDIEKALMLKSFLKTAKQEFNFTLINKSRVRSLQKLGAEWYSTVCV